MFLSRVIKIKFYWFIEASLFFLKDKKLKKFAVALKLLTVLSLNSVFLLVLFACKDTSLLYKSSKTRNYLKPENLETPAISIKNAYWKLKIRNISSYQAEIKYLEDA